MHHLTRQRDYLIIYAQLHPIDISTAFRYSLLTYQHLEDVLIAFDS